MPIPTPMMAPRLVSRGGIQNTRHIEKFQLTNLNSVRAGMVSNSADFAKAAPASLTVAFVSKSAIASAAATRGISILKITTLLYLMKNKAIIIASVCLLTAGGSALYFTA